MLERSGGGAGTSCARCSSAEQIALLEPDDWTPEIREYLTGYFSREICPVLTPLAFDPGHPFPLISNLSKNFAVVVRHGGRTKFARVKVPDVAAAVRRRCPSRSPRHGPHASSSSRTSSAPTSRSSFPARRCKGAHLFRVIRDADLEIEEDEADDLLETRRPQPASSCATARSSLLQVEADMPARVLNILVENFEVDRRRGACARRDRLGFGDWMQLTRIHRPELKDAPFSPRSAVARRRGSGSHLRSDPLPGSCSSIIRSSRSRSVEAFLRAAVQDPHVIAIKMTLYRIGAELAADSAADRGGRGRQAGGGARRAEGALRRAQQHPLGAGGWSRTASTSSTASPI